MKVKVSEASGPVLDWMVAKCEGAPLEPLTPAKNSDLEGVNLPATLYEVVTRSDYKTGELLAAYVAPIKVIRYGVLTSAGATAPSITAKDENGDQFLGSVQDYYLTKEAAEVEVRLIKFGHQLEDFHPSTDWSHGGPIIDGQGISIIFHGQGHWTASNLHGTVCEEGPTPLIAAMRAYVSASWATKSKCPASSRTKHDK